MEKGLYLHPRPQMHAPRQDSGAMEMLIAHCCTNDPKCMHQSKMPILEKAENHMKLWFGVSRQMRHFCGIKRRTLAKLTYSSI
jgi:hypothetical protein